MTNSDKKRGLLPPLKPKSMLWISVISVALYPWILAAFHWAISINGFDLQTPTKIDGSTVLAALILLAAFIVPLINLSMASQPNDAALETDIRSRRFALLAVAAPTLYVFFGVVTYMAGVTIPDPWLWTPAWLVLGYWLSTRGQLVAQPKSTAMSAKLRVAHGIVGSVTALFLLFHIVNHLVGLFGPEAHAAFMELGRSIYRSPVIEPILVAMMLFQIVSGLRLLWGWSESNIDGYRVFQLASGIFMAIFILGHMNSVFIFARTYLGIPTDWAFAAGLPTGLINDPWNIRLLPHYALGVFFSLAHLFSGLRVVMLAHQVKLATANRIWWCGILLSTLTAVAIISALVGVRID
ncbi:hypothetical protein [Shewanella sp. GD03713]|uniref:hypothetical protein n=1 Tax=Shewanella sp. GD03713 TaxID=2975372 RepID=UPI000B347DE8|nr:hypothetical protein [Shewanella sp. GD03713]MDH1471202.1 hypothetical protein [Shewanella sp. GD03713]QXN26166.1 hypothetical protein KVP08_006175 [Shewanella putrefaciens]